MQRFAISFLSAEQQEETAATFRAISLQPVAELSVCLEVRSPTAELLESAAGVDRIAQLSASHLNASPGASEAEGGEGSGEVALMLYYMSGVDPEELAKELCKALPLDAPA